LHVDDSYNLRYTAPDLFEKTLMHGLQVAGVGFCPATATEFLEVINRTIERDMAQA
jgi:hypothetical protein